MYERKILEVICFICGFCVSVAIYFNCFTFSRQINVHQKFNKHENFTKTTNNHSEKYETNLADFLEKEIRILCWVFTHPDNHKKKVPHVKATWGHKCTKLLFMSTQVDPNNSDIIALPIENGRPHLWNKTKLAMKYVYEHHRNDAEWFMRADDDNFILMENLRYTLAQYRPQMSLYIGHRFAVNMQNVKEGYMAGGGHIFSKKALEKFVTKIEPKAELCPQGDGEADDLLVGVCLKKFAIFIDARDRKNQKQIFPVGVEEHMHNRGQDMNYWYWKNLWRKVYQGGLDCCSDLYIGAHYVSPREMFMLEYLVYNVHPFGIEKNLTETLPQKFSMDEIIKASDAISLSPNFLPHENVHNIDSDEKFI
ncbi:hypothetical protein PVAND_015507 [Polypedilum vanderplanki]|uniref:N-acetylgalactosaminide beta-1,3-galactosyltransferase n=1 Tax=Polypedilum vanderplanki TaxID=319348 RepID=A0A9J6BD73_POLVA|nr:hypothetical protein PVAND_015507 [Polypedilum vanderplanki]